MYIVLFYACIDGDDENFGSSVSRIQYDIKPTAALQWSSFREEATSGLVFRAGRNEAVGKWASCKLHSGTELTYRTIAYYVPIYVPQVIPFFQVIV